VITYSFRVEDLKEALRAMFKSSGVKGIRMVLLITDSQIVNELTIFGSKTSKKLSGLCSSPQV
jgi:hypothetical protein